MRRRLTQAISVGLSLAGCGPRVIANDSTESTGEGTSSTSGLATSDAPPSTTVTTASPTTVATTAEDSTSTTQHDAEADAESGDLPSFDLGVVPDIPIDTLPVLDCDAPPPTATCAVGPPDADIEWVRVCIPPDAGGECFVPASDPVWSAVDECLDMTEWTSSGCNGDDAHDCATVVEGDLCCYWQGFNGPACPGRPFLVDGRERIAPLVDRDDWRAPWRAPAIHDRELARAWQFDARNEHAAIASFTRFAMQLLAMAAPPRFVAAAIEAAADEREHAMLFFALAHAHGGEALGPGALDIRGALANGDDPIAIVVATVREGCIAETISAMQLQRAVTTTEDPELRAALSRVYEQELKHVELAWSFVAWAWARGDESLRKAVVAAFADAEQWIPRGPEVEPIDDARWRRSGRLSSADAHAVARATIRDVIAPASVELFASREAVRPRATP